MPRKKTGMPFEAHPSPKVAENGEKLLYVKTQSGLVRTLSEFEMWFHDKFSLRQGDMNCLILNKVDTKNLKTHGETTS